VVEVCRARKLGAPPRLLTEEAAPRLTSRARPGCCKTSTSTVARFAACSYCLGMLTDNCGYLPVAVRVGHEGRDLPFTSGSLEATCTRRKEVIQLKVVDIMYVPGIHVS
jgi:hypothetical protein